MKKSISFHGIETFYSVTGNGFPVLLLHGFGESSNIWNILTPALHAYKLILPDLPGSGYSEALPQENVSMSDYASCVEAIMQQENIDKIHFIGHSMGGYIAMEFANRHADMLASLTLFHSSAYADDEAKIETRIKAIDFITSHGAEAFLKTSLPGLFKEPEKHYEDLVRLIKEGGSFSGQSLVQYYRAMIGRKDHSGLLSTLGVPALFIIGEHDTAVPFKISLKQCYLPSISFVHILRSSAHMGMYEETEKITLIVNDFLKEVTKD